MNLNLAVIAERLSERFKVIQAHAGNTSRFLSRVMLYAGAPMCDDGAIYVACGADLPEGPCIRSSCCIAAIGLPPEAYLSEQYNCIVLEDTTAPAQLLNELQHIFFMFADWRSRLYRAMFLDKGIQPIVTEALKMFENPVYVHDRNYRIFAYAESGSLSDMEDRYGILNYGRLSVKTIQALNKIPAFDKTFDMTEPAYWKKTNSWVDRFNYLYSNLRVNGEYSGRIFVDERIRPISKADFVVMAELTAIVELALQRRNMFEDNHLGYFGIAMVKLLEGGEPDPSKLEAELLDLGWDRKDLYFCFQIRLSEHDSLFYATTGICTMLESIHDCQPITYKDNIFAIVNGQKWSGHRHVFLRHIQPILESLDLHAGVSLMFHNLTDLRIHYEQTETALKFGEEQRPNSHIHYFEDCALDYLLRHSVSEFSAQMLCPRALLALIEHDRKNDTAYSETLRAYLECDSSPAKAMDRLFIHRSTLLYRLNRIQELTEADLSDFRTKLHFLLAFQLLDLEDGADKKAAPPIRS